MNNNNTEYPFQVASYLNNNQTFTVEERLFVASGVRASETDRKPVPPLETPGYSVFKLFLMSNNKRMMANIPEDDMIDIYEDSRIARQIKLKAKAGAATEVRFTSGTYRGKTPHEVLAMPDGTATLQKMKAFLQKNLEKYPNNKTQIDAIDKALSDPKAAENADENIPSTYEIYSSGPKPLKSKDATKGYCFCYNVSITKNLAMRYPYEISITNCEAPMKKAANGQEVPELSKAIHQETEHIFIPEKKYFQMISKINEFRVNFRNLSVPEQLKLAHKINSENINISKSEDK